MERGRAYAVRTLPLRAGRIRWKALCDWGARSTAEHTERRGIRSGKEWLVVGRLNPSRTPRLHSNCVHGENLSLWGLRERAAGNDVFGGSLGPEHRARQGATFHA